MAIAFGGEVEGFLTGVVAPADSRAVVVECEWGDAEEFKELDGHLISLTCAVGVECIKLKATPSPLTDFKFVNQFGDSQLRISGFNPRMPFATCIQLIRDALNGEETMAVSLTADGSGDGLVVNISVSMGYFFADYKLPLDKVPFLLSDKLQVELCSVKQQLAAALIALESTKTELREAVSDSDAVKEQLVESQKRVVERDARCDELKATMAKAAAESRAFEKQLADLRTEIRIRDARIRELEAKTSVFGPITTRTKIVEVGSHSAAVLSAAVKAEDMYDLDDFDEKQLEIAMDAMDGAMDEFTEASPTPSIDDCQVLVSVALPQVGARNEVHKFAVDKPPHSSVSLLADDIKEKFGDYFDGDDSSVELVLKSIPFDSDESSGELYDSHVLEEEIILHMDSEFCHLPFAISIVPPKEKTEVKTE